MSSKLRTDEKDPELNLNPIMNLVMLLVPALLLSTSFIHFSVINVNSPQIGGGAPQQEQEKKPEKPPLNLTVTITKSGFIIAGSGGVLGGVAEQQAAAADKTGPTIPKINDKYDYTALTKKMIEVKDAFPDETKIIMGADADIQFDILIQAMDATREEGDRLLFPDVMLHGGLS